jgi:hypothetical protein
MTLSLKMLVDRLRWIVLLLILLYTPCDLALEDIY